MYRVQGADHIGNTLDFENFSRLTGILIHSEIRDPHFRTVLSLTRLLQTNPDRKFVHTYGYLLDIRISRTINIIGNTNPIDSPLAFRSKPPELSENLLDIIA